MLRQRLLKSLQDLFIEAIFAGVALLTLLSIGLVFTAGIVFIPVAVLVFGLNVWVIAKSDREGFLGRRSMPRAGDPEQHLHPVQTAILVILLVLQVVFISYQILAFDPSGLGQPTSGTSTPSQF